MEEKERFECKYNEKLMKHYTFDNENKEELGYRGVVRVLNQQDEKIKAKEKEANTYAKEIAFLDNKIKQLRQTQNQKAIEELEKLKSAILSERNTTYFKFDNFNKGKDTAYYWTNEIIDNQIKSLKGEETI